MILLQLEMVCDTTAKTPLPPRACFPNSITLIHPTLSGASVLRAHLYYEHTLIVLVLICTTSPLEPALHPMELKTMPVPR